MPDTPPFLRNRENGRVFSYHPLLATYAPMEPYYGPSPGDGVVFEPCTEPPAAVNATPLASAAAAQAEPALEQPDINQELYNLHWRTLKYRVEQAGGTWTNKQDAIAFLSEVEVY